MRILFATWDGGGTVPAEMGVIRQLLAAGHEVTVIGDITLVVHGKHHPLQWNIGRVQR